MGMYAMMLGVEEIRNLALNNKPEVVAAHIRDNAENVIGSLLLLDNVLIIMDDYEGRLAAGEEFLNLYTSHNFGSKKSMPGISRRVRHFSKAIFKFVAAGCPTATKEKAEARVAICEANVCGYFDGSICRHQNCGCYTKIKKFLETESCPVGKW